MSNSYLKIIVKAAIITGCLFVGGCENDINVVRALGTKKGSREEATNIESYISENSIVKAKLISPYMIRTQTDTLIVEFPKTLHVDFYDDSAKVSSRMSALYGRYYEDLGKVYLKDSVVVFNIAGDTLFSDDLWWDQKKQIFYTDKKVRVRSRDMKQNGTGMIANQDFKKWTIYNSVGPLNVADSTLPTN